MIDETSNKSENVEINLLELGSNLMSNTSSNKILILT